jgi:hypothetical protein
MSKDPEAFEKTRIAERRGLAEAGAGTPGSGSRPEAPRQVRASFLLWLAAVAAGVLETVVRVVYSSSLGQGGEGSDVVGLVVRAVVYGAAVYVIAQMRRGKSWAHLALAVLLGGIGTLSLVVDPISWLAAGHSLGEVFAKANLLFFFVAPIRVVHLAAVLAALILMFLPGANAYFRAARSATRRRPG